MPPTFAGQRAPTTLFSLDSSALFRAVTYQKIGLAYTDEWLDQCRTLAFVQIRHSHNGIRRRSRESLATSDDALAAAFRCRGSAAAYLQLIENLMKVPLRCPDANRKPLGDLPIGKAEIDQAKRLHLL
jgi:hypothetical protein